jgi:hypothetical protein
MMVDHQLSDSDDDSALDTELQDSEADRDAMQSADALAHSLGMSHQLRLCCFHVFGKGKALFLQAKSIDEQQIWVARIEHVLREHETRKRQVRNRRNSLQQ